MSGTLAFVGKMPILWKSRRQGSVATSTYSTEFNTMKVA
jgi:hypothetical protein